MKKIIFKTTLIIGLFIFASGIFLEFSEYKSFMTGGGAMIIGATILVALFFSRTNKIIR